mmetsp:Transcript_24047/g.37728  ORF Transcript_24047/g.37728 Transcript_24047/m.37728 type:complete len:133 (-) Transcript_24047:1624-2022(-)
MSDKRDSKRKGGPPGPQAPIAKAGKASDKSSKISAKELNKTGAKGSVDEIDDIFSSKPVAKKEAKEDKKSQKPKGPDMEQIKKEEAKYKSSANQGGRKFVDGLPVYSLEELKEEMGESAWEAFMEAAEPGLS